MMRVSQAFPSRYLKAADLPAGRDIRVTMRGVVIESIDQGEEKPVLYFAGKEKGLVLNQTNAHEIADYYGDEMDDWSGREIILFVTSTTYAGRRVPCIRIRITQVPPPEPAQPAAGLADDDQSPF